MIKGSYGIIWDWSSKESVSQLVQSLSCVRLFATAAYQASLSITNSQSLPKLMSIESVMPSNHLILCCPLLLLPSVFPSIRVFSNESVLHIRWPKYWSFSFNISPSSEHSGLISFRMDWLDLLAVQGTLKSLLQQHSSKASVLQCSAFFLSFFFFDIRNTLYLDLPKNRDICYHKNNSHYFAVLATCNKSRGKKGVKIRKIEKLPYFMSISRRMDKKAVVHIHNGVLLSH